MTGAYPGSADAKITGRAESLIETPESGVARAEQIEKRPPVMSADGRFLWFTPPWGRDG